MSNQIVIWPFSIKKVRKFLNGNLAVHTQTQMQTESKAFKTHTSAGWYYTKSVAMLCDITCKYMYTYIFCNKLIFHNSLQGLSVPFACVGSGDPVRVLRLYTTNTLDTL